jgi:hypothetical protein
MKNSRKTADDLSKMPLADFGIDGPHACAFWLKQIAVELARFNEREEAETKGKMDEKVALMIDSVKGLVAGFGGSAIQPHSGPACPACLQYLPAEHGKRFAICATCHRAVYDDGTFKGREEIDTPKPS